MVEKLRKLNPQIEIYSVRDKEFADYGRVIEGYDTAEIIAECSKMPMPDTGSVYVASIPELEKLDISKKAELEIFGGVDMQTGICYGYNSMLNALEYHKCPEINIGITPFVLILGKLDDIEDGKLDSGKLKAFYVDKGDVVEVFATTLHFCPCQTEKDGFFAIVMLGKGTNEPFDKMPEDKLLFRKNKWLLAHEANEGLIARGGVGAIYGENYEIKF